MQNDGPEGKGAFDRESVVCSDIEKQENSSREEDGCASSSGESVDKDVSAVAVASIAIVISRADACDQSSAVLDVMGNGSKLTGGLEKDGRADGVAAMAPKKGFLARIESYHEQCSGNIVNIMQNDGPEGKGALDRESVVRSDIEKQENSSREEDGCASSSGESVDKDVSAVAVASIAIVISRADACDQSSAVLDVMGNGSKLTGGLEKDGRADGEAAMAPKKGFLARIESYHEQCRVCQQQSEETLMDLGCQCRGELAKAHRSCIELWFRTRGSNKCEICQQVAANVPNQESQPTSSYWIWRVDPAFGGSNSFDTEQERGCFSPLWVAFSILIGGLLLDVLISISLGVSALPVNIIIGVLVVLGLGTALRLALECCHEWSLRRSIRRADTDINPGYHPVV